MTNRKVARSVLIASLVAGFVACSDNPSGVTNPPPPPPPPPSPLLVSKPLPVAAAGAATTTAQAAISKTAAAATSFGDSVVFVALPSGTAPGGVRATIRNASTDLSVSTLLIDGGFDPVALNARVGDSIEVKVRDGTGTIVLTVIAAVRASRPPVVVRTQPPHKKVEVPLNTAIIVVFNEPVDPATVTSQSLQLLLGGTSVPGTIQFLDGSRTIAAFVPNTPLVATAAYHLDVSRAIRDPEGLALETAVAVDFTTGTTTSSGTVASVTVTPTAATLHVLSGIPLTAIARDAAGNTLVGRHFTWSNSDSSVAQLFVTDTGSVVVGGLKAGTATITATSEGVSGSSTITVVGTTQDVGYIFILPDFPRVPLGIPDRLRVSVLDFASNPLPGARVTWSSLTPATATVDSLGTVTGKVVGQARIVAASGGKSDTALVTVARATKLVLSNVNPSVPFTMVVGDSAIIDARLLIDSLNGTTFDPAPTSVTTWSSTDGSVASVDPTAPPPYAESDPGLVRARTPGTATISARVGTLSASVGVTVIATAPLGSIVVDPLFFGITVGDTIRLVATCIDTRNKVITCPSLTWTSTTPSIASISQAGLVAGLDSGLALFNLSAAGQTWSQGIPVWVERPGTARVTIARTPVDTFVVGGSDSITATIRDLVGTALHQRAAFWTSSDTTVATVSAPYSYGEWEDGVRVRFRHTGSATIAARYADAAATATIAVEVVNFVAVSAGFGSCALRSDGAAYCWGSNAGLGIGTSVGPERCGVKSVAPAYWGSCSKVPTRVSGGLVFASLTDGSSNVCGLTAAGAAYCWGDAPTVVPGGLVFTQMSLGEFHRCGLEAGGAAYCWGYNFAGQLGTGSPDDSPTPALVAGGHTWSVLSTDLADAEHQCAITTSGAPYCWGLNKAGELGIGSADSTIRHDVPVAVSGGLNLVAISTGGTSLAVGHDYAFTCGLTDQGAAYCWGADTTGELGNGSTTSSKVPVAVMGGLTFTTIGAGRFFACGLTTTGAAYCWGANGEGELGIGSTDANAHPAPVPVTGGLIFTQLSVGEAHVCGLATDGAVYCWGSNEGGQLGSGAAGEDSAGASIPSPAPVKVAGQP